LKVSQHVRSVWNKKQLETFRGFQWVVCGWAKKRARNILGVGNEGRKRAGMEWPRK